MVRLLCFLIVLSTCVGCTDQNHARTVLKKAGYSEIKTGGYAVFSCSEDDAYATSFTAKGPTGYPVTGAVCCGWFKNCTVRLD